MRHFSVIFKHRDVVVNFLFSTFLYYSLIVTQKLLRLTEKAKLSSIPSSPLHMAKKLLMITNSPLKMRRLGVFVERKSVGSISIEKQQRKKKKLFFVAFYVYLQCFFYLWLFLDSIPFLWILHHYNNDRDMKSISVLTN